MAQVSDSIAAAVTLKADGAIRDLSTLSRKAKDTGQSFNQLDTDARRGAKGIGNLGQAGGKLNALKGSIAGVSAAASTMAPALAIAGTAAAALSAGVMTTISAQARLADVTNATRVTFKDAAGEVEKFAKNAVSIGLSKRAAMEAATGFGALFTAVGYTSKASAAFATGLTTLSADLASTFGGSVEDAAAALRALFRGEMDPIEKYNIKVNEAAVTQRALQLGLAATAGELSEQDKALSRLTLAYSQSTAAQGDFTRTQAETANQERILAATTENLQGSLGKAFTPAYTNVIEGLNTALGVFDAKAEDSGASIGKVLKTLSMVTPIGFIGGYGKDAATGFENAEDAVKTFAQELNNGRAGSKAYTDAITYLKKANTDAEETQRRLKDELSGTSVKMAEARRETRGHVSALQQFISAEQASEDATIKVADGRRNLADAERSVAELRAKGRYDAKAIADAERSVADASRGVASARRAVIDAEAELARLRAGPTAEEADDADRAVRRAQLNLEQARRRQADAERAAMLAGRRGPSAQAEAALALQDAVLGVAEAEDALQTAQEAHNELLRRGVEGSKELATAEQTLADARANEESARQRQVDAEAAARAARAGDPEFERNLARANDEVTAARRSLERAERDLPFATLNAKLAQDELSASWLAGTPAADRLSRLAHELGLNYAFVAGAAGAAAGAIRDLNGAAGAGVFGSKTFDNRSGAERVGDFLGGVMSGISDFLGVGRRAAGGPITAGKPYLVGEKGPELIVPKAGGYVLPNGSTGMNLPGRGGEYLAPSTPVHMHINAPIDAGTAATIEYAARVVSWKLDRSGRR